MNVLHIVADGRPGGGTTNVLALIEDQLGVPGLKLGLVTQTNSYAFYEAEKMGVDVYGLEFFKNRYAPPITRQLHAIVSNSFLPDIVHVHGARAGYMFSGLPRGPFKVAYTVRGYHFLKKPFFLRILAAAAERRSSQRADATIHVCKYDQLVATRWRLVPSSKMQTVIHNGIKLADFPRPGKVQAKLVAFLGRLNYQKDPLMIVEIARLLESAGYSFILIGGGEMETVVRRAIVRHNLENRVRITGALPRPEALSELSKAEAFIFPSRWEGLPIAPVEAMQMAVPVVAANVSGLPEIIQSEQNGILIDERRPEAYASALRRVVEDASLRSRLIANGHKTVKEKFTRERVLKQHINLYNTLKSVPAKA